MNIKNICLLAVVLIVASCGKKSGFTIQGNISGLPDSSMVYLLTTNDEKRKMDTTAQAMSLKGKFTLSGFISAPEYAAIKFTGQNPSRFILENSEIQIIGDYTNPSVFKVTGSKSQDELVVAEANLKPITDAMQKIQTQAMQTPESDIVTHNRLEQEFLEYRGQFDTYTFDYARNNPNSVISPMFLIVSIQNHDIVEIDEIYLTFTNDVKNTKSAKYLKSLLDAQSRVGLGKKAPNLVGQSPAGKEISLYDIKGKVTLIDFWASWCRPCREENPNVVKLYNEYKDKGLVILGVSLDKDASAWEMAIEKDKLTWYQISDLQGWESPLAQTYNVQSIPATVLLDENGVVVAKDLRGSALNAKIAELLGKK